MKASELQINKFLKTPDIQFVIPVYQRNYDWTNTQCNELLLDIIAVETENRGSHFIGSIVFIHDGAYSVSNDVKELVIIDGQQRLTTINILYVALYRFAKSKGDLQNAERIYNMFLTNQYVKNEESKLKLKQTDVNSLAFKAILLGNETNAMPYSNVIENYNFFRGKITDENFDIIYSGLERLMFVEISLERDKDDPQRIFESLNSTGLDLSQSDLIRNYILMDLSPREQNRIYETIWNPIEENARDYTRKASLVSDFIRDFLTLRNKKIPNKNLVYAEFKKCYTDKKSDTYFHELETMRALSQHYKKFINPSSVVELEIRKELEYINRLEINVAFPFLLQVFEDHDNGYLNVDELVNILKLIQSYVWRRFIVGLPTNALNKIFMTLYAEVDFEDYYESIALALLKKRGSAKFPTNEEIEIALKDKDLYNTQPKNKNYLFERLENYNNREFVNTSSEEITVEHIFPRNPDKEWSNNLSVEQYVLFKDKFLNTIGNLTLSGNNGALSNKSFLAKKEMNIDGGEQGYNFSRLWLNSYLKTINQWTTSEYEFRFRELYNRFLSIWEMPAIEILDVEDFEEQSIFDAEIPTHKKLEYFIFENTKVEEDTVAQMYFYVIRNLYERNTPLILANNEILKLTREKTDFRVAQELLNGWYIESNIDSNTKFQVLKKLLTLFELEDELIIKYASANDERTEPNRFIVRKKYWQQLLPKLGVKLFENRSPSKDHWISAGAGNSGFMYALVATKSSSRIELLIAGTSKEKNKSGFNQLVKNKEAIETAFGCHLVWEELPDSKMSKVLFEIGGLNLFNENDWAAMNDFFVVHLPRFENAFQPFIEKIR